MFLPSPLPPRTAVHPHPHNFSQVRGGDLVALAFLVEGLQRQYGRDVRLGIVQNSFCDKYLDRFPQYFFRAKYETGLSRCPFAGHVWLYQSYCHSFLDVFPVPQESGKSLNDTVVIAPLFDAYYNEDRKWSVELYREIIAAFKGREVVVIGDARIKNKAEADGVTLILGDMAASLDAIEQCATFIGGDSGTTHYAGIVKNGARNIISIYGPQSQKRFDEHGREQIETFRRLYVQTPKPEDWANIHVDFSPKTRRGKRHLYLEMDAAGTLANYYNPDLRHWSEHDLIDHEPVKVPHNRAAFDVLEKEILSGNRLEIGMNKESTPFLAWLAIERSVNFTAVDKDYENKRICADMLSHYNLYGENVRLVCEEPKGFLRFWSEPISFLHTDSPADFVQAKQHLTPGAIVMTRNENLQAMLESEFERLHETIYRKR